MTQKWPLTTLQGFCLAPTASLQIHKISWDEAIPLYRRLLSVAVKGRRQQVRIPAYTRDFSSQNENRLAFCRYQAAVQSMICKK